MHSIRRLILHVLALLLVPLGLAGCGGGGGSDSAGPPPIIIASLLGFPTDGVPAGTVSAGFNTAAAVVVLEPGGGTALPQASVMINGAPLRYEPALQGYIGELTINPGDRVTVVVSVGGATYSVATSQFSAYPTITTPASGASWSSQSANLVAWTGVAPSPTSVYALGVLDTDGQWVWPPGDSVEVVPAGVTSYTIDPGSLSPGNRFVVVGVATVLPIVGADAQSVLVIGGFNAVPITVSTASGASLVSIAIAPDRPTLGKGGTRQLTATGTYSDNSTRDLTAQVAWSSSAPAIAQISASGAATGVDFGTSTLSATLAGVTASTVLTVFQPTPSPAPPLARSVTYQIDYAHSGRATFGAPLVFPPGPNWSITLPGTVSYPLVADGKVFVTTTIDAPGSVGTYLVAIDAVTGAVAWGPVPVSGTYAWSSHAYDHGKLFVINFDGLLRSFDAATGVPGWTTQLSGQYAFTSPPTAVNGVVYVGGAGTGGTLYAVDESSGGVLWTAPVANGDHSSPAVSADGVFVSYPCQVYKFDPLSGVPLWHVDTGCSGGGGRTAAYANGRVYVREGVNATVQIRDGATGTLVGSAVAGPIPALSTQAGYFLGSGVLRSIDLGTQAVNWSFSGDGQLVLAPIVIDDIVVVGSASGKVYALSAASGAQLWVGDAGAGIQAPDEHNVAQLTGFGAGEGLLVVPAGHVLTGWRITGP